MKKEKPDFLEKITAVIGDCTLPNMGIEEKYINIIKDEVIYYNNIIYLLLLIVDSCFNKIIFN